MQTPNIPHTNEPDDSDTDDEGLLWRLLSNRRLQFVLIIVAIIIVMALLHQLKVPPDPLRHGIFN